MKTGIQPMQVQSKFLRDDLRQYEIPARAGQSLETKSIVVEIRPRRSRPTVAGKVQSLADD